LLEYRLAVDLKARGFLERIFPLFIGDKSLEDGTFSDYFSNGCHPHAPDIVVKSVEEKMLELLEIR
jgi:hypothetical protein